MKNKYKKREKWFWEKQFGLSYGQLDHIDPVIDRLNYRDSEVNDDDLFWISTRIKVIGILDLGNTLVTDEGIKHLTGIAITELGLKNCRVTKACLPDLNKIGTLESLHFRNADVVLEDLFNELPNLKNLRQLIIDSTDSEDNIKDKMSVIAAQFPNCKFIVNHTSYE